MVIGLARAEEINWTSNASGIWNNPDHWDALQPPGANDAVKHLKMFSHIQVGGSRSCYSFEGTSGVADRFLLITSGEDLTVGDGGLRKSIGAGTPVANFAVKVEDGVAGNNTILSVHGVTDGMDLVPASKYKGHHVSFIHRGISETRRFLWGTISG